MDAVTQWVPWVPWVPQVGDVRPEVYRFRYKDQTCWCKGLYASEKMSQWSIDTFDYQIPAPPKSLEIDLPYLLKKSAACSPSTHAAILSLKAKFADDVCKLIEADRASRLSLATPVNEKVDGSIGGAE